MTKRHPEAYGDRPIEPKHHELMNTLAKTLDEVFNGERRGNHRQTAFVLMVFPFGREPGGRVNYISNGVHREDMVTLFRDQAEYFEASIERTKDIGK
jgi:hypothetical protein